MQYDDAHERVSVTIANSCKHLEGGALLEIAQFSLTACVDDSALDRPGARGIPSGEVQRAFVASCHTREEAFWPGIGRLSSGLPPRAWRPGLEPTELSFRVPYFFHQTRIGARGTTIPYDAHSPGIQKIIARFES
jgi:hypothetical protein